jgi:hypothetical protein
LTAAGIGWPLFVPSPAPALTVGSDFKMLDGGSAIVVVVILRGPPLLVSVTSGVLLAIGLS